MKTRKKSMVALASALFLFGSLFTSCDCFDCVGEPFFNVDPEEMTFSPDYEQMGLDGPSSVPFDPQTITVLSNVTWKVVGCPAWITLDKTEGVGGHTVIKATINPEALGSESMPEGIIKFSAADGILQDEVHVTCYFYGEITD